MNNALSLIEIEKQDQDGPRQSSQIRLLRIGFNKLYLYIHFESFSRFEVCQFIYIYSRSLNYLIIPYVYKMQGVLVIYVSIFYNLLD